MDKACNVPINTNNWLIFSLYTFAGAQVTGAVTGDFTIDLLRSGINVFPTGIYIHEIGLGRYHVSNSAVSSIPYRSAAEEQVYLRIQHNTHDSTKLFHFWAYDLVGRIETIVQNIIDEAFAEAAPSGDGMGGYLTREEIETRLGEVRAAIAKARTAQSYAAGSGMSVQRGLLKDLYVEEKWLLELLQAIDATPPSGGGAAFINKAKFVRPI